MTANIPAEIDFQKALDDLFQQAQMNNMMDVTIKSGELHRLVGGYPTRNHRMPICCLVMRKNMHSGDNILSSPPKGDGSTLVIRYRIPRGD
ncbi:MAG: HNH endonuclease [Bellilinea sp.]